MDILNLEASVIGAYEGIDHLSPIEDPTLRVMSQRTWLGRMINEYKVLICIRTVCRAMSSTSRNMMKLEKSAVDRLEEFANEERRHGICAVLLSKHLAVKQVQSPSKSSFPFHEEVSPLEGTLRNLLSICCLSETVAVALIAAEREEMPEGVLKDLFD